jgi:hypothetical protein
MNPRRSTLNPPPSIEVHIEELVLHGFPPGDRHRIGEALERELGRILTEQGVPLSLTQGSEVTRLDGGAFEMPTGSKTELIGAQVAQSVYGGLIQ